MSFECRASSPAIHLFHLASDQQCHFEGLLVVEARIDPGLVGALEVDLAGEARRVVILGDTHGVLHAAQERARLVRASVNSVLFHWPGVW